MTTNKKFNRDLKDIPELITLLRAEKDRQKDYLVKQGDIVAVMDEKSKPAFQVKVGDDSFIYDLLDQAHGQVAGTTGIPKIYYDRLKNGSPADVALWTENVGHWLSAEPQKKRLLRLIDGKVRGWLSSRYRPLNHLDVITTAIQAVTGRLSEGGGFAEHGRCFAWNLSSAQLRVQFFNPRSGVDLNHLEKGVQTFGPEDLDENGFFRGMKSNPIQGEHWVFPVATVDNSETGHGGLGISRGLLEGYCMNGTIFKRELSQVHIGKELQEVDLWSTDTVKKYNAVIYSKAADVFKATFEPAGFLNLARKFKGLEAIEVDVKVAADQVAQLDGMTEEVRDDILAAYHSTTAGRANLFDFQRAVTATAHAYRDAKPEVAAALEELGGELVENGKAALAAA